MSKPLRLIFVTLITIVSLSCVNSKSRVYERQTITGVLIWCASSMAYLWCLLSSRPSIKTSALGLTATCGIIWTRTLSPMLFTIMRSSSSATAITHALAQSPVPGSTLANGSAWTNRTRAAWLPRCCSTACWPKTDCWISLKTSFCLMLVRRGLCAKW